MWFLARLLLLAVVVVVAATMLFSGVREAMLGGAALLTSVFVVWIALDWWSAFANERAVRRRPELLKNSSIGAIVRACGPFHATEGSTLGVVHLYGERWRARCPGAYVPDDGEALTVGGRVGLTLYVKPLHVRTGRR